MDQNKNEHTFEVRHNMIQKPAALDILYLYKNRFSISIICNPFKCNYDKKGATNYSTTL
jgi:hypothetical protein